MALLQNIDARFERVERALGTLIDSITKYNPSNKLAADLAAADSELVGALADLERHRHNVARIHDLQTQTAQLDTQIRDTISALWAARRELKNTPVTRPSSDSRTKHNFTTEELLAYARRISRNTMPPPGVTNGFDFSTNRNTASPTPTATQTPSASFNGAEIKTGGTPSASGTPANGETTTTTASQLNISQATTVSGGTAATELPIHLKPIVNPHEGATFIPWPEEHMIRGGALASFSLLVDEGKDPRGYDPEEEEQRLREEEEARKAAEEQARLERDEAERRMREEHERMARERERARQEAERRGSVAGGAERPAQQAQFTFLDGLDDDDD
ncbi:vitamin-D-receptor interacting mediator subunit 4-domain-containing protein [Echria macrotheca]|uniref:Mediator of RNA polymerase II transcription subunit 4 n=1 Tax=Echria macrotheca TaxID=438768 RepID=A0AAJ0BEB3_9PEZI|nr:vitamin-D-receptor interacting mediator subunit 4-domain-containing protein [Echria macrotheca]